MANKESSTKERKWKFKLEIEQIICIILCCIALIGFILPAINIQMELFMESSDISVNAFSIVSLFNREKSQNAESNLSQIDFSSLIEENSMMDEMGRRLITSIGFYFATIVLLILIFIFTIISKFKRVTNIIIVLAVILYIYAGYVVSLLQDIFYSMIEESLGFFTAFIDISDMLTINLGSGYWLTITMLVCILFLKVIFYVKYLTTKKFIFSS